ncbi:MAG: DUF3078 domain-containing protein [Candidatus Zixiibacteriota bacterium]
MFAKIIGMCAAMLVVAGTALAQSDSAAGWKTSLVTDLTVTQTSYSDSWVGGEAGSVNWVWNLDGTAERQLSTKVNLKSTLRLKFGQTLTQDADTKDWAKPRKSTDLIDWENVFRFTLGKVVDPYAAVRLESQFFDGSVAAKKLYLSPLKLTESFGVARQFYKKENETFTSRIGLAARQIFKTTIIDLATLETDDSTITDGGVESVTDATLKLAQNIQYVGKLSIFKALFSSESDREHVLGARDVGVHWSTPDVNWENTFTASVTTIVSVSLYTQVLYDKDIDKRARFKETLALGFTVRIT